MFGRNKDNSAAKAAIAEALADINDKYGYGYAMGLINMAYSLGAITQNERADYIDTAYQRERAAAAQGQPVYKKKGVYEFMGYHILKDFAKDAGDGSACWCIKKIGSDQLLARDLKFKDAAKKVQELAQ